MVLKTVTPSKQLQPLKSSAREQNVIRGSIKFWKCVVNLATTTTTTKTTTTTTKSDSHFDCSENREEEGVFVFVILLLCSFPPISFSKYLVSTCNPFILFLPSVFSCFYKGQLYHSRSAVSKLSQAFHHFNTNTNNQYCKQVE